MGKIAIFNETKQEICKYKKENPLVKQMKLRKYFLKNTIENLTKLNHITSIEASKCTDLISNNFEQCESFNEMDIEIFDKLRDSLQFHSSLKTKQSKISSFF